MSNFLHFSDTHGRHFWKHPLDSSVSAVVHTGDLFPNKDNEPIAEAEQAFQEAWLAERSDDIRRWLEGRPLLYVSGNHDFTELETGIPNAIRIQKEGDYHFGLRWAGFSEIPFIKGRWAGETTEEELQCIIDDVLSKNIDILLTHAPPHGVLDTGIFDHKDIQYGIPKLADRVYKAQVRVHCFGHVHVSAPSITYRNGTLFINGASKPLDGSCVGAIVSV